MPENTSEPNQGHTGQIPVCHKCSIPMQLKMTAPHKPRRPLVLPADILERTFKCPTCGHSEIWIFGTL